VSRPLFSGSPCAACLDVATAQLDLARHTKTCLTAGLDQCSSTSPHRVELLGATQGEAKSGVTDFPACHLSPCCAPSSCARRFKRSKLHCARVAPFKQVRLVEFIDQIPKSPIGKMLRRECGNGSGVGSVRLSGGKFTGRRVPECLCKCVAGNKLKE